jgi:hypothetical protein
MPGLFIGRFRVNDLGLETARLIDQLIAENRAEAFKAGQEQMREKAAALAAKCWGGGVTRNQAEGTAAAVRALPIAEEPER